MNGRSGVPDALRDLGSDVQIESLRTGDYAIDEVALIERKAVRDLHLSVIQGRLWSQMGRLRRAAPWRYLVVEGCPLYDGPLAAEAVRGLLIAVDELGITRDPRAGLRRFCRVDRQDRAPPARSLCRSRSAALRATSSKRDPYGTPLERALGAAEGVSTVTARKLLGRVRLVDERSPCSASRVAASAWHRRPASRGDCTNSPRALAIPASAGIA